MRAGLRRDGRRRVEVRPEVAEHARAQREDAPVGGERELRVHFLPSPLVDGQGALGPRLLPFDRPAQPQRRKRDGDGLRLRHPLAAEGPADVGDDDAQLLRRPAQHLRQAAELAVVVLVGGLVGGDNCPRLDRRRDQTRRHDARADDGGRGREGLRDVARRLAPAEHDVVGRPLVQRLGGLRLARVDERGQLLDVDDDVVRGVGRELRRLRHDERDRLADVPDAVPREHRMREPDELLTPAHDQREVVETVRVGHRQDRMHARQRERALGVDRDQAAVRIRAAHERAVQHLRQLHVADVLRLALDEALVLGARQRLPHPRLRGRRDRAHAASSGSRGSACSDSAPPSPTTVSAPSWRPICSSGVIGFGWTTIAMPRSIVRPGGGCAPSCQ